MSGPGADPPADGAPKPSEGVTLRDVAEAAGLITVPAAGFAALGLYFGWRRTNTYAQYFGLENSVLGFSFQEYVLRSASSVYRIVQISVAIGIATLIFHRLARRHEHTVAGRTIGIAVAMLGIFLLLVWGSAPINRTLGRPPTTLQAVAALFVASAVVVVARLRLVGSGGPLRLSGLGDRRISVVLPGLLTVLAVVVMDAGAGSFRATILGSRFIAEDTLLSLGLAVLVYAFSLLKPAVEAKPDPMWLRVLLTLFVALFLTAGLFAATDKYAQAVGVEEAELTVALLPDRRGVIVYSAKDLGISSVARCVHLTGPNRLYPYRCDDLRLFAATDRGVLILPAEWSRADGIDGNDRIILIPYDESIRLEFTPGAGDVPNRDIERRRTG